MKNKKVLSTSLSLGLSLALLIGNVSGNMNNVKAKGVSFMEKQKNRVKRNRFI